MHTLRFITSIFLISLLSFLTGCKEPIISRIEIEKHTFVRATGIDISEENNNVKLTIVSEKVEADSKMVSDEKKANIVTSEGKTIFEANRNFHSFTDSDIFWGHSQFILISEAAAKENIMKYLDYYIRDHELRLTSKVLIVEGSTVEEFFKYTNSSQYFIGEKLENLASDVGALSLSKDINIYELIDALENKYSSAYIPIIYLVDKKSININDNSNKMDMKMEGYAIFKEFKMIGSLHGNNARGLNWITNNIESGVIVVKDSTNNDISLEIIDSNSKIKPKYNNDQLSVMIEITMNSNIVEQEGIKDIYNEEDIENLKKQQEDIIELEVKNVIKYAQKNNVDIMGIGNAIFHKYPVRWEKELKDKWDILFPQININIEVKSIINRVYNIKQPIGAKK